MLIDMQVWRKGANGMNLAEKPGPEEPAFTTVEQVEAASRAIAASTTQASDSLQATASPTQIRALLVLRDTGGCSNAELAGQLKIFPSSASRITDRLTATGWITRQTAPQDRREIRLVLTPAGHRTVDQFVQNRRDIIGAVLTGMKRSEQMALLRGLTAYADAANRLNTTQESR